jgi:hypothetical protein
VVAGKLFYFGRHFAQDSASMSVRDSGVAAIDSLESQLREHAEL